MRAMVFSLLNGHVQMRLRAAALCAERVESGEV